MMKQYIKHEQTTNINLIIHVKHELTRNNNIEVY